MPFKKNDKNINKKGRPIESDAKKLERKIRKKFVKDYIETLTAALPDISPILIKKAKGGDIIAIKELNDRALGKAKNNLDITTKGDKISLTVLFDKAIKD